MDDGDRWGVDSGDGRALPELSAPRQAELSARLAAHPESKQSYARYPQPVGSGVHLSANPIGDDSFGA